MFQERGFSYPRIRLLTLAMGHGWSGRGLIRRRFNGFRNEFVVLVERGRSCHAPASWTEPWTERVQGNHSTLFVILFVTTGIFLLVLMTLVYFLFTGQNEEAKSVLSPFVVLLFFIVWTMLTRLGEKR